MSNSSKPIDINDFNTAIKDLADANLFSLKHQLENSISKLEETNVILKDEIKVATNKLKQDNSSDLVEELNSDLTLFNESIEENSHVLTNQRERLKSLSNELGNRGLIKQESESNHSKEESKEEKPKEEEGIFL